MSSSNDGEGVPDLPPIPRKRVVAYRRAAMRPPIREQVNGLLRDLACQRLLAGSRSPHARGAALAVGFAALRLAVTPVRAEDDRRPRDEALQNALPCLDRTGLGHIGSFVAAALACDVDPARLVLSARGRQ